VKKIITNDGSATFYNDEYKEAYHSVSGAVEKSFKKFVEPCKIKALAAKGDVRILDICFGLGYNCAAAIDAALEENSNCRIEIISLEKDKNILSSLNKLNPKIKNYHLIKELVMKKGLKLNENNIRIKVILGDAANTIKKINGKFNAVFLDPFSPPKNPELWTADFFREINRIMDKDAVLSTYSCAKKIRESLSKAGFDVFDGPVVGRKSPGTIAVHSKFYK